MRSLLLTSVLLFAGSCATPQAEQKPDPIAPPAAEPKPAAVSKASLPLPPGLDEASMDPSADPCSDFYQFACGNWMKTVEIPADRAITSRGFVAIAERNEQILKAILEEAAAGKLPAGTPFAQQLGDYYASCIDEPKLEGTIPELLTFARKLSAPKNARDLAQAVGTLHASGISPLFNSGAQQDLKNSAEVIAGFEQGGLGLPDRDYYLQDDAKMKGIREAYVAYVENMLVLIGEKPEAAKKAAGLVMDLETRLAKASQTKVERRDPNSQYNRVDRKGLKEKAPNFQWDVFFTAVGAKDVQAINVNSIPYFVELSAAAKDVKPETWKAYLTWVIVRSTIPTLPKAMQDAHFAYSSKNFTGAKADRPRWKKCVAHTDGDLGEALGREFVRRTFGEDGKKRTNAMVEALQGSIKQNLEAITWMEAATKPAAFSKLERMVKNNKIGYPDVWRDYASIKTDRGSFFNNSLEANRFEVKRQLAKIGKPVDRNEWLMSASTVNAYNDPQKNEIVFPAGILQPPFFNRDATDAVNFGSMGMVVGHEITHGFDDEGRKFDVDGNLKDWWSEGSAKAFEGRAECVKKQYDTYVAIDDVKVKGDLTLGENTADLGGLKLAHAAMGNWYGAKQGKPEDETKYRYTRSQQFFLGFAQSWCTKMRPENARLRAATDPHAPPYWRVIGPLSNIDAFQQAFECKAGTKMVRAGPDRCDIW
ncbi:MAG: Metallopeptidase [Myxococcaceae bacterium]|nr:Metallopeptidase [Myxococcaceae bacterium]